MAESKNVVLDAAAKIARGEPPSNVEVTETLERAKEAIAEQKFYAPLVGADAKGRELVKDVENVLSETQAFIEDKNRDEKMQRFIAESRLAAEEIASVQRTIQQEAKGAQRELRPIQDEAMQVLQLSKQVAFELVRSPSFRRILLLSIDLFQDAFWSAVEEKGPQVLSAAVSDLDKGKTSMHETRQTAQQVKEDVREGLQQVKEGLREGAEEKPTQTTQSEVPASVRDKARELRQRFNSLLKEVSKSSDYQQAVNNIFALFDHLSSTFERLGDRTESAMRKVEFEGEHVRKMWATAKEIIEEFTGRRSVDHLVNSVWDLYEFAWENQRLRSFFHDLRTYIESALKNPSMLEADVQASGAELDHLIENGKEVFSSPTLKAKVRTITDEIRQMAETIQSDKSLSRLSESTKKLLVDLVTDTKTGKPSLWALRDSLDSMRPLLLPVLLKELEIIPISQVQGATDTYNYALSHIVLTARDLIPERFHLNMDFDVDVRLRPDQLVQGSPYGSESDVKAELLLKLDRISPQLRDIYFRYERTSFPRIEDWGWSDVNFTGDGVGIEIRWKIVAPRGEPVRFVSYRTQCSIDSLDIDIKHAANHPLINRVVALVFAGSLKDRIEREIEGSLDQFAESVAENLNDVFAGRIRLLPALSSK